MLNIALTKEQKQLTLELLKDRYMALMDMAASAAHCGDMDMHDILSDDYWNINQVIKQLEA